MRFEFAKGMNDNADYRACSKATHGFWVHMGTNECVQVFTVFVFTVAGLAVTAKVVVIYQSLS